MKGFEKLLSPIEIAPNFVLKNRMIKAPQSSWRWNEDCTADGSDAIAMYENMAEGGVAAIDVAAILWEPAGGIYLGAYDDRFIPGMIELNEAVHKHGCLTIGQLHHIGPSAGPTPDGLPPISSSTLSEDEMPVPKPWCQAPRGLTVEEIHEKQRLQIEAAVRLQKGGFDAVEVHVAHGYFLDSFVSPLWNKRDDEYGCQNVENRTRIVREIIEGIREACGPDFVIGCRLNGREFHPTKQGITAEQAAENARAFVEAGAQYISIAGYGYGPTPFRYCPDYFPYPEPDPFMEPFMDEYRGKGLWTAVARQIKDAV
ncbi:MAG: NADH:flavin oxidoreductase, partial [Eggerthella sp.]